MALSLSALRPWPRRQTAALPKFSSEIVEAGRLRFRPPAGPAPQLAAGSVTCQGACRQRVRISHQERPQWGVSISKVRAQGHKAAQRLGKGDAGAGRGRPSGWGKAERPRPVETWCETVGVAGRPTVAATNIGTTCATSQCRQTAVLFLIYLYIHIHTLGGSISAGAVLESLFPPRSTSQSCSGRPSETREG